MALKTPNLGLPLGVNGKIEFEQSVAKAVGILAQRAKLAVAVRTEGMPALRASYRIAMTKLAPALGLTVDLRLIDGGMSKFGDTFIANMIAADAFVSVAMMLNTLGNSSLLGSAVAGFVAAAAAIGARITALGA